MSDARKAVAFERIGAEDATYKYDSTIVYDLTKSGGSVSVGLAVGMTGNAQVGLVADAQMVEGKLVKVESDGFCTVQIDGMCSFLPGTGATLVAGDKIVGCLLVAAKGYIRTAVPTVLAEVHAADGEVIDASDVTAIVVDL